MMIRTTTAAPVLALFVLVVSTHVGLGAFSRDVSSVSKASRTETAGVGREPSAPQVRPALAGVWIGVYQVYPFYVQMTLTIAGEPAANGEAAAELRVEGFESQNSRHMGVSQATVRYQDDARAIDITADGRSPISGLRFHAVYDADRQVFAGYRIGAATDASPYFLMVRQGGERRLFERIRDMPNGVVPRGGLSVGGSAPSADVLRKWASQIFDEYPDIDPYRTQSGSLYLMARNLFRDEYFKPFFGKTYDELSNRELGRIKGRLQGLPPPRSNFPEERANGAARPLERGFWVNVGTFAAPDIMLSVVAMRSISAWKHQTLRRLDGITPAAGVFDVLNGIEAEERGVLGTFWPSERQAVLEVLDSHRSRLAGPALRASINERVGAATRFEDVSQLRQTLSALAQPPNAGGATSNARVSAGQRQPTLAEPTRGTRMAESIGTLASLADETLRGELRGVVEQKIAVLVAAEAELDRARISASSPAGDAMSRLEERGGLYRELQTKYASAPAHPAVQALFADLARQRQTVLADAQPQLDLMIGRAASEQALNDILARFLNAPSDRSDVVGGRLVEAVDARRRGIRLAQQQIAEARQQAAARRERITAERTADVAARRRALIEQYGVHVPTLEELYGVLNVVPLIAPRTRVSDEAHYLTTIRRLGFSLDRADGDVMLDVNRFSNSRGHKLVTHRVEMSDGLSYLVALSFPGASDELMKLYASELRAGYREMRTSTPDLSDGDVTVVSKSPEFVKSGGTVYSYDVVRGEFTVTAISNSDARAWVVSERLNQNTLRVNSYSRATDVELRAGQRIHLRASGQVTLGPFVGASGPNGVEGYANFRFANGFRLGSLIGRIEDGEWFLVGSEQTIVAPTSGTLMLKINDNDLGNNDGAFEVTYTIDDPNR